MRKLEEEWSGHPSNWVTIEEPDCQTAYSDEAGGRTRKIQTTYVDEEAGGRIGLATLEIV